MAAPPKITRIRSEDFPEEDRPLVSKLAAAMNGFMDEVIFNLTGKLDFQNLNQQVVTFTVSTDATGLAINPPSIRSTLASRVVGIVPISVSNTLNPTNYPTSCPLISFTTNSNIVKILAITGLGNSQSYSFTVILIGANV
jgi:hypothetical protein